MWAETPQSAANNLTREDIKKAKYDATARSSRQELAIVMKALEGAKEEQMKEE